MIKKIGIIGMGLIGGSISLNLTKKYNTYGVDSNDRTVDYCRKHKVASQMGDISGLKGCDVVFVCVPLGEVKKTIQEVYDVVGDSAIITDVASCKQSLSGMAGRIVGGHPMAGTENSGITAAKAHLFENAYYVLVKYENTSYEDMRIVENLVGQLKAQPIHMGAEEHDKAVAKVSHLPHMVAYSLVSSALKNSGDGEIAGSGFTDTTRIALSSPTFWTEVARQNKGNILKELDVFFDSLNYLYERILADEFEKVQEFFKEAKIKREKIAEKKRFDSYDIDVDVVDEVGAIGRISKLLADNNINIKNIQILNSREGSGGALRLTIADEIGYNAAKKLLVD